MGASSARLHYGFRMRTAPALLTLLALSVALTGCVPDEDPIVVDPDPSVTPIFESDEEALAAAEAAYGEYFAVQDQILIEGGQQPERVSPYVSEGFYSDLVEGFALYSENGWHSSSETSYDSFRLQQHIEEKAGATVIAYLCLDVTRARIIDSSGADVTPASRADRVPIETNVEFSSADRGVVTRSDFWSGEDFCV